MSHSPVKDEPASALPTNRFGWSEWSGAFGDLGISLPIIAALAVNNFFELTHLFALWGIAYVLTGWWFRIPLSIQPLKAMAILALVEGYHPDMLAAVGLLYGLLFVILARSGLIERLQRVMKPALIRGVQLGIGLMLGVKAWELSREHGWTLYSTPLDWQLSVALLAGALLLFWLLQFRLGLHIAPALLGGAVLLALVNNAQLPFEQIRQFSGPFGGPPVGGFATVTGALSDIFSDISQRWWHSLQNLVANPWYFIEAATLLIITQLPLTLGNAVYAADETARDLWPDRVVRVNTSSLALSIGRLNIGIGLLGGFPVCHGAGGLAAHAQFGARTGGATIILGLVFIAVAIFDPLQAAFFAIPVVLLAALLLIDAVRMLTFVRHLETHFEIALACAIALVSVLTKNLMPAIALGALALLVQSRLQANSKAGVKRNPHCAE